MAPIRAGRRLTSLRCSARPAAAWPGLLRWVRGDAARVGAIAHGGQVLLSETAAALVRDSLPPGAALRDLGAQRLKDLGRPVQVFQLDAAGLPAGFPPSRPAAPSATGCSRRSASSRPSAWPRRGRRRPLPPRRRTASTSWSWPRRRPRTCPDPVRAAGSRGSTPTTRTCGAPSSTPQRRTRTGPPGSCAAASRSAATGSRVPAAGKHSGSCCPCWTAPKPGPTPACSGRRW